MNKKVAEPSTQIQVWVNTADHAEQHTVSENEVLCACPRACAVADAWARLNRDAIRQSIIGGSELAYQLDQLVTATRNSPLRQAKS